MASGTIDQAVEFIRVIWQSERGEFGDLLRSRRLRLGHSQIQMAEDIGIHQSQISRIEQAITTPQNYNTAMAYAKANPRI